MRSRAPNRKMRGNLGAERCRLYSRSVTHCSSLAVVVFNKMTVRNWNIDSFFMYLVVCAYYNKKKQRQGRLLVYFIWTLLFLPSWLPGMLAPTVTVQRQLTTGRETHYKHPWSNFKPSAPVCSSIQVQVSRPIAMRPKFLASLPALWTMATWLMSAVNLPAARPKIRQRWLFALAAGNFCLSNWAGAGAGAGRSCFVGFRLWHLSSFGFHSAETLTIL